MKSKNDQNQGAMSSNRPGRRNNGHSKKGIAKRVILYMLATMAIVIVGSLTYAYIVPLVMMVDFPGAVSGGVSAAEGMGEQMADVTEDLQKKADSQMNGNLGDGPPSTVSGTITKVVDGDTLDVDGNRIRLALANTPERGESGYSEAVLFTKEHCPVGTTAVYDADGGQTAGSYGRTIAKVWCYGHDQEMPEASINAMLVNSGHAEILGRFCYTSEFGGQKWAQDNGC